MDSVFAQLLPASLISLPHNLPVTNWMSPAFHPIIDGIQDLTIGLMDDESMTTMTVPIFHILVLLDQSNINNIGVRF